MESIVPNTNWQKGLKKGRRNFVMKVSALQENDWSEKKISVLSIDVELVVIMQRHNSCFIKPICVMR